MCVCACACVCVCTLLSVNFCPLLSAHDNSPTFTYHVLINMISTALRAAIPHPSPFSSSLRGMGMGVGDGELGMGVGNGGWEWGQCRHCSEGLNMNLLLWLPLLSPYYSPNDSRLIKVFHCHPLNLHAITCHLKVGGVL